MSPEDAEKLVFLMGTGYGLFRRGRIKSPVLITDRSPEGLVFMAFHSPETKTNIITSPACDPVTKTPEFKYCAVRIEKYCISKRV